MRLFTIAPELSFLEVLAEAVLAGFPLEADEPRPPLSRWRIFVPTRRAARSLEAILAEMSGARATLLPHITPFGDVDEDELAAGLPEAGLDDALSTAGQLHLLVGLVRDWARANPQEAVARDLLQAPEQQLQMALSLQDLIKQLETEEAEFGELANLTGLDLAVHRGAVISLFTKLRSDYRIRLHNARRLGPSERRNLLIRQEAERIRAQGLSGPTIAAGSTGSNPATRDLLQAIAASPPGAVVFPGLDTAMPDEAWADVDAAHPFFAMKTALTAWDVPRSRVAALGPGPGARSRLAWEALAPPGASRDALPPLSTRPPGLTLVEARDQAEEARVIALRLRRHVVEGEGPAALVTPDRTLAARVQAALSRWQLQADDSAGEPLADLGLGALLVLLLRARRDAYAAEPLLALLHHPDCTWGLEADDLRQRVELLEIACVRGMPAGVALADLPALARTARSDTQTNPHAHPALRRAPAEAWDRLDAFIALLASTLAEPASEPLLESHLDWIEATLEVMSPAGAEGRDSTREALTRLLEGLKADADFAPEIRFPEAALLVEHHARRAILRPPQRPENRIMILGLAEARLVPLSLAILGGLNEGTWPAVPDIGPWLSRNMREKLHLEMPEREIGLTAHDFVQGLARPRVMLTWSMRLGGKPALPSRLVLRLRSVLEASGLRPEAQLAPGWVEMVRALDRPEGFTPLRRPRYAPPVAARPTAFSVTDIERLVRDSYHIHARHILGLAPLPDAATEPDYALRGTLIHAALARWAHDPFTEDQAANLAHLLNRGRKAFAPYMHLPDVARFWWPRFVRMARALVGLEQKLREGMLGARTEISGAIPVEAAGVRHTLTARADRIDILPKGRLRLIDYKSGGVPTLDQVKSGFAPQLPLEAVIAREGGFKEIGPAEAAEAYYVRVSGSGKEPAKLEQRFMGKIDFASLQEAQFAALKALLASFQLEATAYIPRHNLTLEDQPVEFDHLSRRREWELSGSGG